MSEVKRFMAPGPWITRDLKECVRASDYDAIAAELAVTKEALSIASKIRSKDDANRIRELEAARRTALAYLDCEHPMVCAAIARLHEVDSVSENELPPPSQEQAMKQTLHTVKAMLESDSIEYDDIRNLLTMVDGVLNPVDMRSQSDAGGVEKP